MVTKGSSPLEDCRDRYDHEVTPDDFKFSYRYFRNIQPDGSEHRFCFATAGCERLLGFPVWHEEIKNGHTRAKDVDFVRPLQAAEDLAKARSEEFRKSFPPCTYHPVLVGKAEFAGSVMKEEYRTLRRWVLAQGIDNADFAISTQRDWYRLSFRSMTPEVERAIVFLRTADVLLPYLGSALTIEHDGRLEDLRGYKG